MTSTKIIFVASALFTGFSMPAMAANGTTPLGDCYNHVISVCNKNPNVDAAHACADSAMDACDKEHSAAIQGMSLNLKTTMRQRTMNKTIQATKTQMKRTVRQ